MSTPLTEEWLKANGFKWHQLERQPNKHWLLWIGHAVGRHTSYEDLGLELTSNAPGDPGDFFCWLRDDAAHRYHRFIHLRHCRTTEEVVAIIEALINAEFDPRDAQYGSLRRPEEAKRVRAESERLDRQMNRSGAPWSPAEKDETRGGALPEHLVSHMKSRGEEQ